MPDLSPVAVKRFDALNLDRMKPGQKVVPSHNASLKVVPPLVAVYDHCYLSWDDFGEWILYPVKESYLAEVGGSQRNDSIHELFFVCIKRRFNHGSLGYFTLDSAIVRKQALRLRIVRTHFKNLVVFVDIKRFQKLENVFVCTLKNSYRIGADQQVNADFYGVALAAWFHHTHSHLGAACKNGLRALLNECPNLAVAVDLFHLFPHAPLTGYYLRLPESKCALSSIRFKTSAVSRIESMTNAGYCSVSRLRM